MGTYIAKKIARGLIILDLGQGSMPLKVLLDSYNILSCT